MLCRFSLDTNGTDSDGEREVHCLGKSPHLPSSSFSESSVEETTSAVESESPQTPVTVIFAISVLVWPEQDFQIALETIPLLLEGCHPAEFNSNPN